MSASIYWIPLSSQKRALGVWTPSAFVDAMTKAFGESPWRVGGEHLEVLRGMAACWSKNGHEKNPFETMMDAIQADGEGSRLIEVWPEY